jgi:peptidoglycan/xylan/chitin deacetylase (PgdA/CDA1 family)
VRYSHAKKNRSMVGLLLKILILTLCVSPLVQALVSQATVIASDNESSSLMKQINQLHSGNSELESQNFNLESSINQNETLYKKRLNNVKIAYLTFDDGPSSNTTKILEILKEYNIKATFFVNGHPDLAPLYKQISDEGHAVANHTYSHDYKNIYISPINFHKDVKKLDDYLTQITGKQPTHVLRFPGGSNNTIGSNYGGNGIMNSVIKEMNAAGYACFDWNVDSSDASTYRQDKNIIVQTVLAQSSELKHAIILMHDLDQKSTTVEALPEIIEGLQNKGFIFDVLSKDTNGPQFNKAK